VKPLPAELGNAATLHGLSAFTTVRTLAACPLLLPEHLARLEATCAYLGLPTPETRLPRLEPLPWGLLRLTVTADGSFWNHRPLLPPVIPVDGAVVRLTGQQVHPQLGRHKTGNYLPYLLARREAEAHGAFEGLLIGGAGHVADGSRSGLLLRLGGEYLVPEGGLPSVTCAAWLAELGSGENVVPISLEVLAQAQHVWLCGSGVGVVPVGRIAGTGWTHTYPADWPQTRHPALVVPDQPLSSARQE
jgi:4-amino-4-deoxychorismate lyase